MMITLSVIQTTSATYFTGEALKKGNDISVLILGDVHADKPGLIHRERQMQDLVNLIQQYNAYSVTEDTPGSSRWFRIMKHPEIQEVLQKEKLILKGYAYSTGFVGLCDLAREKEIVNSSAECRNEIEKTVQKLKSYNNKLFQEYLKKVDEKLTQEDKINYIFELNIIYELAKAFNLRKHKIYIVTVGADHLRSISELMQKIFNFKVILQKNFLSSKTLNTLYGSKEKSNEIATKVFQQWIETYPLDLPEFFKEALKAQPIRSRL